MSEPKRLRFVHPHPHQFGDTRRYYTDNSQLTCLYVIEIGKGRIKVGLTNSPEQRLKTHRGLALAHGAKPGREWRSPHGSATSVRENDLIEFCARRARTRFRSEYFTGVPFMVAVEKAAELCGDADTLRRIDDERRAEKLAVFDAAMMTTLGVPRVLGTVEETAVWLKTSVSKVNELIDKGALPVVLIGRMRRIPVAAIRRLAA